MAKINWSKALVDYISDESLSYQNIAEKYGITKRAVEMRATKDQWVKLRVETSAKLRQKLPEKTGEKIAEINVRHASLGKILQSVSIRAITPKEKGGEPDFKPSSFEDARLGVLTGVNIERNAMQIEDKSDINIQINLVGEINDYAT